MMSIFRSADPPGVRKHPRHPVGESMWGQNAKRNFLVPNPAADVNFDRFNYNYEMHELREVHNDSGVYAEDGRAIVIAHVRSFSLSTFSLST
jgi:hypothetical protein